MKKIKLKTEEVADYHGMCSRLTAALCQNTQYLCTPTWDISILGRVISILLFKRKDLLEELKEEIEKDIKEDANGKAFLSKIMSD